MCNKNNKQQTETTKTAVTKGVTLLIRQLKTEPKVKNGHRAAGGAKAIIQKNLLTKTRTQMESKKKKKKHVHWNYQTIYGTITLAIGEYCIFEFDLCGEDNLTGWPMPSESYRINAMARASTALVWFIHCQCLERAAFTNVECRRLRCC